MNAHRERRLIALLFSLTAVLLAALWVFGLHPARERVRALSERLDRLQQSTAMDASDLDRSHARLRRRRAALQAEFDGLRARTRSFTGESPVGDSLPSTEEGRIDYKVALLEARSTLFTNAANAGMSLPAELGLPETIEEEEEPETRLWQLAAVIKTLRACMAVGVPTVREVRPLPPLVQGDDTTRGAPYREYPVFLRMECSFESAVLFLQSLQQPGHFFPLRGFMMESVSTDPGAVIEVLAIPSADLDLAPVPANHRPALPETSQDTETPRSGRGH